MCKRHKVAESSQNNNKKGDPTAGNSWNSQQRPQAPEFKGKVHSLGELKKQSRVSVLRESMFRIWVWKPWRGRTSEELTLTLKLSGREEPCGGPKSFLGETAGTR